MLNEGRQSIKDTEKDATIFNKYFFSIIYNLNLKKKPVTSAKFRKKCKTIKEKFRDDHFSFKPFTVKEITKTILQLSTYK